MKYYIGIDIGTTSTKAVAFSEEGEIIAVHSIAYQIYHPSPDRSEQNPDEIFEAVINCMAELTAKLPPGIPLLVAFSSAMHSLIAVDINGRPTTGCIIWADNRSGKIAESLRSTALGKEFYYATGVPVHAMSPFCKLLWLKQNEPGIFSNAHKFIGIKEYVFFRIFGKYIIDTSLASATGLLNIHTLQWDDSILSYIGLHRGQLSMVTGAAHSEILPAPANLFQKRLAILENVPFVIGGSDGGAANLGSGAAKEGSIAVTVGTSSAIRMITTGIYIDPLMRTFCYHLKDKTYITGGAGNNGAVVIQWLKDSLLKTSESFDELFSQAATIPAGCDGLIFIPYILGERAPVWNADAKGVFFGLDITHTKAHLIRAAMEGVIYCIYSIGKILTGNNDHKEIHASGGFTKNPLWLQILSDVFNCRVCVSGAAESSASGAVMIGMEALGITRVWEPAISAVYEPDLHTHVLYKNQCEKSERIYDLLKNEMGS